MKESIGHERIRDHGDNIAKGHSLSAPQGKPRSLAAAFNEMGGEDAPVAHYEQVQRWLAGATPDYLATKGREAEVLFRKIGITFSVYTEGGDPERLIPFDIIPRIIAAREWEILQKGLTQRVRALNAFIADVYHGREILRAGRIPELSVLHNEAFLAEMQGFDPPQGVYTHVAGIDLVRVGPTEFYVLEDNCRTPSGVSYMLENRETMMRLFPDLYACHRVGPVSNYPDELHDTLYSVAPANCEGEPTIVLLTPGRYNSAYYEHSFLADEMGIELVEGVDLVVDNNIVYMRTTEGPRRVDVIYRRIDDIYLDPLTFRPDSALGVPGLFNAYRAGNVALANAVGAGIADDKAIYPFVPDMIHFYLGEEPILKNVPTFRCAESKDFAYVMDNLDKLVVKMAHGSGGYGMLVGPHASKAERDAFAEKLKAHPGDYIAQPTLALSTCPTYVGNGVAPRHVDLRPFVLYGKEIKIVPGGLTRVALREGSLVVNSSQGGGTKDTWVLEE